MRRFHLVRSEDPSGVSGTGNVAEGIEFTDGTVVIRWRGTYCSTVIWENIDAAMYIHGHNGLTKVVWVDEGHSEKTLQEGNDIS